MPKNPLEKIREFFRSDVELTELSEIPNMPLTSLRGVDLVYAQNLQEEHGIEKILDLAQIDPLPEVPGLEQAVLEKWVKICSLVVNYSQQPSAEKKIILAGLDNAGKTSLLSVLQNKYSVIKNLLPTRGLSRETLEFFGMTLTAWDLGGQIAYREKLYFQKPELFFSDADLIIFVLDIQDTKRYDDALDYLESILKAVTKLEENPLFLITFNKFDPDLTENDEFLKNKGALMAEITKIKGPFRMVFTQSSIYDRTSVERMFSIGFKEISQPAEALRFILKTYCERVKARAVTILSPAGMIYESYAEEDADAEIIAQTSLILQTLYRYHVDRGFPEEDVIELTYPKSGTYFLGTRISDLDEAPLYFWIITANPQESSELLEELKQDIIPLLAMFI
ncbi:MAG TPA: ADP-ribosylation factor-like protein [Candidatus Lokiarchaeia archaeon]|nr:ADP-ribosylation factor-like protein [Candidatus Lokiarchaeia archaeon]